MTESLRLRFLQYQADKYQPQKVYWSELKKLGYTIERKIRVGWYVASPEGYHCGKTHKILDDLYAEIEDFSKLELERINGS